MLRQIRASRLKTFALVTALCGVAFPIAAALLWDVWGLADIARSLGMLPHPIVVGLAVAIIPVFFSAIEIWLPIRLLPAHEKPPVREPMSDAQIHWNAVRLVAVACILVIELIAQVAPTHRAAHAAPISAR